MQDTSVQAVIKDRIDPVLEAIIQGLIETKLHPERPQAAETVTTTLAQALLASVVTAQPSQRPALTEPQIPLLVTALAQALSASLAPAIAASLTPALAAALAPAIATSLTTPTETTGQKPEAAGQESQSSDGSYQQ